MTEFCWADSTLKGQTAIVTGGSGAIGRAVCVCLAKAGAFVAIGFRHSESLAGETLDMVLQAGGEGVISQLDVGMAGEVETLVSDLIRKRSRIDILVNNAGTVRDGLLARMKDPDWDDVLVTNLSGAFYLCRSVAKNMVRNRRGRIVNIASTAGESGNAGQVNYSAAKAGIIGLTKSLARELAPRNILVNAVSPGIIQGGMTEKLDQEQLSTIRRHVPLGRIGVPEDVAAAVLFLCSGMSNYITGQVIRVNGGLYM